MAAEAWFSTGTSPEFRRQKIRMSKAMGKVNYEFKRELKNVFSGYKAMNPHTTAGWTHHGGWGSEGRGDGRR